MSTLADDPFSSQTVVSGSEDVFESNSTYYGKTDRSLMDVQEQDEVQKSQEVFSFVFFEGGAEGVMVVLGRRCGGFCTWIGCDRCEESAVDRWQWRGTASVSA